MAPPIPQGLPTSFRAGDTVQFTLAYADYPISDSWVLSLVLVPLQGGPKTVSAGGWFASDGTTWTVTIAAADSAKLDAGLYRLVVHATKGSERRTAEITTVQVEPDYATADENEYKATAEARYQLVSAELEARLSGQPAGQAHEANSIAGRAITKIPLLELRQMLTALEIATGRSPLVRGVAEVHRRPGRRSAEAWS